MVKPCIRISEGTDWCFCVPVNLGLLTLLIGTSPLTNIFVDTRPKVTLGNNSLSCMDAWMSDGMKMVEDEGRR